MKLCVGDLPCYKRGRLGLTWVFPGLLVIYFFAFHLQLPPAASVKETAQNRVFMESISNSAKWEMVSKNWVYVLYILRRNCCQEIVYLSGTPWWVTWLLLPELCFYISRSYAEIHESLSLNFRSSFVPRKSKEIQKK